MFSIIINNKNEMPHIYDDNLIQIIDIEKRIKINKNINSIILLVNAKSIKFKKILKRILNIQKKCFKKNINIGININNQEILAIILNEENININNKNYNDLETILALSKIKNKKDRIEYIYDKSCDYLDNECKRLNYCDFNNDVCIAKRNPKRGEEVKMGCCYHVNLFSFKKHKMCEYLSDKGCTTKCFACKLFTCDAIKEKYKIKDIVYADCFFNIFQKLILRISVLTPKEKIINRLLWF